MTFNQAKELDGHVKAGSKGSPVVYAEDPFSTLPVQQATPDWFVENYARVSDKPLERLEMRFRALEESTR